MTPLAHAGHWYHAILYLAPVLLVVFALWVTSVRERRAGPAEDDDEDDDVP